MLLTENFLSVIIRAYQISPNIAGQQLIYNFENQKFEAIHELSTLNGLKRRFILFCLITIATIIRIIGLKLKMKAPRETNVSVETNICIMILFMFTVVAERYRIRGKFPNDFVDFLNGVIVTEKSYGISKYIWL